MAMSFYNFHGIEAAYIHVSNLCNFNCKICDLPKRKQTYVPTQEVCASIDKAQTLSLQNIILTGQEALLHPKIHEILRYGFENGVNYITFNTNGLAFADDKLWERLESVKEYWDRLFIAVSVNFHDQASFSEWSGHKSRVYETWVRGFKRALNSELDLAVDVIMKKDVDILNILAYLYLISFKCRQISLRVLELLPFSGAREYAELKHTYKDTAKLIKSIAKQHKGMIHFESFPICVFDQQDLYDKRFFIYNFHLLFGKIPLQYDVNIYETFYPGPTENWKINVD